MTGPWYIDPHPDLLDLGRIKPCRSLGCTEVIGVWDDMSVNGVPGFCRGCFTRLMAANGSDDNAQVQS